MKKFVSIVIALVMVLSMTSAFAITDCSVGPFNWDCLSTYSYCGKGSVAVVPYVKVNNSCGGWDYQESDCAGAVNSENVFFGFELTVEAYPNVSDVAEGQQSYWWNESKISATAKGLAAGAIAYLEGLTFNYGTTVDWTEDEDVTYLWNTKTNQWIAEDEVDDIKDYVYDAPVEDAKKAEVCIKIESDHSGLGEWTYGDYKVVVAANGITITKGTDKFVMSVKGEKVNKIEATDDAFLKEVQAAFNLGGCVIGTCINADNIKANFGWDDEQEDCFGYSADAATTVNPECAVTVDIPKTGDVSVVAYAVMAIVAAAGTMLKK